MEAFARLFSRDAVSRDTRSAYLDNDTFSTKTMDETLKKKKKKKKNVEVHAIRTQSAIRVTLVSRCEISLKRLNSRKMNDTNLLDDLINRKRVHVIRLV